jgi:succinoglycan biosynthesis transport protein ExoP
MAIESPGEEVVRMDIKALRQAVGRRWLRILIVTLVLLGGTYFLLQLVPKSYESSSSILVESRDSAYTQPTGGGASGTVAASPDAMISSQIELVKSRDTLIDVVRSLKLAQVPEFNGHGKSLLGSLTGLLHKVMGGGATDTTAAADTSTATLDPATAASSAPVDNTTGDGTVSAADDEAAAILADHLTVARARDAAVILVTVRSADPVLAAKLANAVAEADVARRAGLTLSDTADSAQWLDQQITQMRQRVSDAETKVANFKVNNDLYTGASSISLVDQQLTDMSAQISASRGRSDAAQSRSGLIRSLLAAGQPIDGVDDVRNSVTIQQLVQQRAQLVSSRAQLLATLLPTHPTVEAATAQISAIDKQITAEGRRVADALDAEVTIEATLQKTLQTNLDALKAKAANATKQTVTLDALDREAKADRNLLENYLTRFGDASSRTEANSTLPDVRVVTLATPSSTAASPKSTFILAAVAFVSLTLQIGAILFGELLSGRALTDGRPDCDPDEEAALAFAAAIEASRVRQSRAAAFAVEEPAARLKPAAPVVVAAPQRATALKPDTDASARARTANYSLRSWFSKRARAEETLADPMAVDRATTSALERALAPEVYARQGANDDVTPVEPAPLRQEVPVPKRSQPPLGQPPMAEPKPPEPQVIRPDIASMMAMEAQKLANLSSDLILGRTRIVVLGAIEGHRDSERLAARLIADVLHRGLSVALVDAGSGLPSSEPGVTDLAMEASSFGDVVHRRAEEGFAEVPWGHQSSLDTRSPRPLTLVQALSDVYEIVLVLTGPIGPSSSLPMFQGLKSRLVLVTPESPDESLVAAIVDELDELGYPPVEIVAAPARQSEVA